MSTKWQNFGVWKYLTWLSQIIFLSLLTIALIQEVTEGSVYLFGYQLGQYYRGTFVRLLPYLFFIFGLIPFICWVFRLTEKFYFNRFLLAILLNIDAFTHVHAQVGYRLTFNLPFWGVVGFDKIGHFLGGLVLGYIVSVILYAYFSTHQAQIQAVVNWTFWLGFGLFSIVFTLWEIIELLVEKYGVTTFWLISSRWDTNEDLLFNTVGYLVGFGVFYVSKLISDKH